ncbi:helix-turn-helix domain-containing protein [Pantoea stewartii]|uniref:helix-turn-helix domain-containing protein n=1 Tax=Pantoea stewartii TaxID=66269 RepID=UPI0019804615|nr:AraC family transcriptional regulator [Pantoea stewartii]
MFSIPFPVITLLALLMLMLVLIVSGRRAYQGAILFIAASALLIMLGIIRWEWHFALLKPLQALLATLLPSVAWSCFTGLTQVSRARRLRLATLPVYGAMTLQTGLPALTDGLLFLLYAGYGIALLRTARKGTDILTASRLRDAALTQKMMMATGGFLCFSAVADMVISLSVQHAPGLIAVFQGMMLPLICLATLLAVKRLSAPEERPETMPASQTDGEHLQNESLASLCLDAETRIREQAYYLDHDLTLNKLARKLGIPARQISRAVNATRQCNVSQWLNAFRVERAQQMLRQPHIKITDIMLETGFISKSNFNREFLRITGKTPTAFRQAMAGNAVQC